MKKGLFLSAVVAIFAMITMSFTTGGNEQSNSQPKVFRVTTDANGEIASIKDGVQELPAWRIRDLSGYTNIRERPNGRVCMRLKARTQYIIVTWEPTGGWLPISSIYNETQGYDVRLHSSRTGEYYIAKSILYRI